MRRTNDRHILRLYISDYSPRDTSSARLHAACDPVPRRSSDSFGMHSDRVATMMNTPQRNLHDYLAFKTLVKRAHEHGIAVILDDVYNHLGPSDLDLWQFDDWSEHCRGGIYFYNDDRASTPWGETRPDYGRGEVRQYLLDNALMWFEEYHVCHLHEGRKVIALHRWDKGGPADYVGIVANFFHEAQDGYIVGFPASGTWKLRFNSDWNGYSDDFSNHPSCDVLAEAGDYDGFSWHEAFSMARTCRKFATGNGGSNEYDHASAGR